MSISAVGSTAAHFTPRIQQKAEPPPVQKDGNDAENDGDGDDGQAAAVNAPAPALNIIGQTIGSIINVAA